MTPDPLHTARIYQFPPPARTSVRTREETRPGDLRSVPIYEAGAGSWYHEAAIREADHARTL